ncbi:NADPH-dependent 7-cyano-7-deazaguanine reductase QueF [Aestuariibacter sp. AA17]|uniref:NADPH-dependent 7-cyano-7-deazaguanine reductase n=1 Tax=Fluctibacter corallii TaxID=2984329 RepID=A0ABT3A3K1_9ALTE|nr:NADPH-dependent 7-cyano-7-deazaguanine reductase QueF [Aestuariibacter sp. AA17]MCV2883263.1 NADPH-dependent 7-cyano-7-deazaguanine reductase QueF [Aestuariibacter sp. AA17]
MTDKTPHSPHQLDHLSLGKTVEYTSTYAPELLQGVPRTLSRDQIGVTASALPFHGEDIWNGYELSWLNEKGKPQVAIMRCSVPYDSPNLIESKSFKLYLNSFNQQKIASVDVLKATLEADLSATAGKHVSVDVFLPREFGQQDMANLHGENIDDIDIDVTDYDLNVDYLALEQNAEIVTETLTSDLLKSNCLITNQPDWASVQIAYTGKKIDRAGLLHYLISFRMHNEFHEQCVERIFVDIMAKCQPESLTIYARYTRRGGLDINPIRSNVDYSLTHARQARQ